MSLPYRYDDFYRRMSERFMKDRATLVNMSDGMEPAPGYKGEPVASAPREVACFYPATSTMRGGVEHGVMADVVQHDHSMLVAHDEVIREGDRVLEIRQRNGQVSGPFTVVAVRLRRAHQFIGMVEYR